VRQKGFLKLAANFCPTLQPKWRSIAQKAEAVTKITSHGNICPGVSAGGFLASTHHIAANPHGELPLSPSRQPDLRDSDRGTPGEKGWLNQQIFE
jgi:hypothetical protein